MMSRKTIFIIFTAVLVVLLSVSVGFALFTRDALRNKGTDNTSKTDGGGWALSGTDSAAIPTDLVTWANARYAVTSDTPSNVAQQPDPVPPFSYVNHVEFRSLSIPEGRQISGYGPVQLPTFYGIYVLRDGRGDLYSAPVHSYDSNVSRFSVESFGPVLNREVAAASLSLEQRRLSEWPPADRRKRAEAEKAQPVLIPYPYVMEQVYYQFGSDVQTARFEHINTGEIFTGLSAVLDAVESDWRE